MTDQQETIELTEAEAELIEQTRSRGLAPEDVVARATRDHQREQQEKTKEGATGTPAGSKPLTQADLDKAMESQSQATKQKQDQANARDEIDVLMNGVIDATDGFKNAPAWKRSQLHVAAIGIFNEDPKTRSMNKEEMDKALTAATEEAIKREAEFSGGKHAEEEVQEMDKRLEAQKETGEGGGAARSSGGGSTEQNSGIMTDENMEFDDTERKWPTDAEIEKDIKKGRKTFLKQRGIRA